LAPHSKRSSASDPVCEANTEHKVWIKGYACFEYLSTWPPCTNRTSSFINEEFDLFPSPTKSEAKTMALIGALQKSSISLSIYLGLDHGRT
jgi:hypothetical protein